MLLAWWGSAWLTGRASADDVLDAMAATAAAHSVRPAPELSAGPWSAVEGSTLVSLLAQVRRSGVRSLSVAFPAEGDPVGLAGPRDFNRAATEATEAVLVPDAGVGAVPLRVGSGVTWTVQTARRRPPVDLGEADRGLRSVLLSTLDRLERLDIASWSPEAADEVLALRSLPAAPDVPGVPDVVRVLAARGLQARSIVEVALEDHGGAVSSLEVTARRDALVDLDRAARLALTAAGSPDGWPPDSLDP